MAQRPGANPYLSDAVLTASPQRLVVMLYDRLLLDFDRAYAALLRGDHDHSHQALVHAQDIVHELQATLDVSVWAAGEALVQIYQYVTRLLVEANLRKHAPLVAECRELMEPLAQTWRDIAGVGVSAA